MPDGTVITNVPEGVTQAELLRGYAAMNKGAEPAPSEGSYLSNPLVRLAKGMKDPIDAGAQMIPRALNTLLRRGLPQDIDVGGPTQAVSDWLVSQTRDVDRDISESEKEYQAAQKKAGTGFDAMRLTGNVLSPANAIPTKAIPLGGFATPTKAFGTGVISGAVGSEMQPVTDEAKQADFAATKTKQGALGGAVGGPLSAVTTKIAQVVTPAVVRFFGKVPADKLTDAQIDVGIRKALDGARIDANELSPEIFAEVREQVRQGLSTGRQIDVPSAARLADAKAIGIDLTKGQATRDPMQYAREVNLRGVENVGEPLTVRFQRQGSQLRDTLGGLAGNAQEPYRAGGQIMGALKSIDDELSGGVTKAYRDVRASTGKDASLPMQGLAQDAARIVDDFGDAVPSAIRSRLARFGILEGQGQQQTKLFTFDEAEKLLQQINAHDGPRTDDAVKNALGQLRASVKRAVTDSGDDIYGGARGMAAQRFQMLDEIPAMDVASRGGMAEEDFVNKHILNGKTGEVLRMGSLLRQKNPEAFTEARSQIGTALQRAAYGENAAGDKIFKPEEFAKALRTIGTDKLLAFYSPAEVETLQRVARVGASIYSHPDRAAVNTSNNSAWAMNILQKLPMGGATLALAKAGANVVGRDRAVKSALAADVPAQFSPEIEAEVSRYLAPMTLGAGVGLGAMFR